MSYSTPRANRVQTYTDVAGGATAYTLGAVATVGYDHSLVPRAVPLAGIALDSAMSYRLQFWGQGADNDTITFQAWSGSDVLYKNTAGQAALAYRDLHYLGLGTLTLSTIVPDGSNPLIKAAPGRTGAVRWADTLVWTPGSVATTPPGPLSAYEATANRGTWAAFSPGSTTANVGIAELICPHFMNDTVLVLDFKVTSATINAANALITSSRP